MELLNKAAVRVITALIGKDCGLAAWGLLEAG